jgi:hypothetical protein
MALITSGLSMSKACEQTDGICRTTMFKMLDHDERNNGALGLANSYAHAMECRAEILADQLEEEARENKDVNRARLIVDTHKWVASKLRPKRYGDRVMHAGDKDGAPLQVVLAKGDEDL